MATNFEVYKDEIIKWIGIGSCVGYLLATCKGVPMKEICKDRSCKECFEVAATFLQEEHIEQPKLTKRERCLCEYFGNGYIAKDENGLGCWYPDKPEKASCNENGYWILDGGVFLKIMQDKAPFDFIKWEDEKPWAVEDLLKLEVIEVQHETD